MAVIVCTRCNEETEGMEKSPYPGPLSDAVLENVRERCWKGWIEASLIMLNEYRLNLLDPKHAEMYDKQMLAFFNLGDSDDTPKLNLTPPEPPKP